MGNPHFARHTLRTVPNRWEPGKAFFMMRACGRINSFLPVDGKHAQVPLPKLKMMGTWGEPYTSSHAFPPRRSILLGRRVLPGTHPISGGGGGPMEPPFISIHCIQGNL